MTASRGRRGLLAGVVVVCVGLSCLLSPLDPVRWVCGITLLFLPGMAVIQLIAPREDFDRVTRLCVGYGGSLLAYCAVFMALSLVTDRITGAMVLLLPVFSLVTIVLFGDEGEEQAGATRDSGTWLPLLLAMTVAAFLRFMDLGYSEYQGDEAGNCVFNALRLAQGSNKVLFEPELTLFTRPPAQVLLPAVTFFLTGTFNEAVIRFPFALAGLATVWMMYRLGSEICDSDLAGIAAAVFSALSGYMIAFSRVVQYQSVTTLALASAALFFWRLLNATSERVARRNLLAGTAMFGLALLAHFEAVMFLPLILVSVARSRGLRPKLASAVLAGVVLLGLVGAFYVPLAGRLPLLSALWEENPASARALMLRLHLDTLWVGGSFYNGPAYIVALTLFAFVGWARLPNVARGFVIAWFLPFFVFYMVVSGKPDTHVNTFFPPWILLASTGAPGLWEAALRLYSESRLCVIVMTGIYAAVAVVTANHVFGVFVANAPEYWGTAVQEDGLRPGFYGLPHRRGWKAVGYLFRTGQLDGSYRSNERSKITTFYLRQSPGRDPSPQYLLWTVLPQSRLSDTPEFESGDEYALAVRMRYRGRATIEIYARGSVTAVQELDSEAYDTLYDSLDLDMSPFSAR